MMKQLAIIIWALLLCSCSSMESASVSEPTPQPPPRLNLTETDNGYCWNSILCPGMSRDEILTAVETLGLEEMGNMANMPDRPSWYGVSVQFDESGRALFISARGMYQSVGSLIAELGDPDGLLCGMYYDGGVTGQLHIVLIWVDQGIGAVAETTVKPAEAGELNPISADSLLGAIALYNTDVMESLDDFVELHSSNTLYLWNGYQPLNAFCQP